MVLAFSLGIGDVITAGKLAKTVISELKKTGEAAPEYQALLVELESLTGAMEQISKLDTVERQLDQLNRIKAIIKSCQDPLQKFLDRISKFDQSLGEQSDRGKSAKNLGRRVQWKLAYKDDVTELRAVLRGHVGLLTLLINLQTLEIGLATETSQASDTQTLKTQIEEHRTLLQDFNGHQRTFLTSSTPQNLTVSESSGGNDAALQSLATKMDESLSLNDGNQAKIDEQAAIVRKIEADVTSLKQDYTQTLNTAVNIPAAAISIPIAAIVSGLVCQTLEVSHPLVRRQRTPKATRRVLNHYAFNKNRAWNSPSIPPRSHSPSVTEPSAGHRDTEVSQTPILEPTSDEGEWEAVWSSYQPTETDDNNSSVTMDVPHGLPSGGRVRKGSVADYGYYCGIKIVSVRPNWPPSTANPIWDHHSGRVNMIQILLVLSRHPVPGYTRNPMVTAMDRTLIPIVIIIDHTVIPLSVIGYHTMRTMLSPRRHAAPRKG